MYAIIAFIPIIVTIIVMAGFNWPAKIALPLAWLITAIVCFAAWKMDIITIAAQTIAGFLNSIDTIVIIFGAILIMNTLKQSGGMGVINRMFTSVSDDLVFRLSSLDLCLEHSSRVLPVLVHRQPWPLHC